MNKLRNKIFIVLFSILTIFSLSLIIVLNYRSYHKEYASVESKLSRLDNRRNDIFTPFMNENIQPVFIDSEVYVVTLNNNEIVNINSYSDTNITEEEIEKLANNFLKTNKKDTIGSLYFNKYAYIYNTDKLIILNITESNKNVNNTLRISILLLIILEIITLYISYRITKWIVVPVEESFNKQKQFIYDASHELKTPIAVIMANAETLESDTKENKWLTNIKNETDRMSKLVINLLDLSKSDEQVNLDNYETTNISKVIEMSLLTFESLIYEKNLKLDYKIDENINFKCDSERIKQLLSILMDNAIKHSLDKSKITVNLYKEKDNIYLTVKNRGEEIPVNEREKIFERFYRVDKSRNRNDNRYGLGLAIAKNIVTNHNGNIHVECSHGYTTFIVNFKQIN